MKSDYLHKERVFFCECSVSSGSVKGKYSQKTVIINNIDLQGVVDVELTVAFLVDGAGQSFVVRQHFALTDDHGIAGIHSPECVVLLGHLKIFFLYRKKFPGNTYGICQFGLHGIQIGEENTAVGVGNQHLKLLQKVFPC